MALHEACPSPPRRYTCPMSSGLVVTDLSRRFGSRWAVARASLELPRGEVLMLTGANGSGKTTLLRCLATAIRAHHGGATWDGVDLWQHRAVLRQKLAYLSHATRLYDDLSAHDNLAVWTRLGGLNKDLNAVLEQVQLPTDRRDPVRTFSAGMRRRLSLARLLLLDAELVLMDEPFSAFDPSGQQLVREVIAATQERGGSAIVTTHVPELAAAVCTRRAHLDAGQVVAKGAL